MWKRQEKSFSLPPRSVPPRNNLPFSLIRNVRQIKSRVRVIHYLWLVFFVIECYFIAYYYHGLQSIPKGQGTVEQTLNNILSQSTITAILLRANNTAYPVPPPPLPPEFSDIPERGYPKLTHLVDYPTAATETEIQKHDRLLVQSLFNFTSVVLFSMIHPPSNPTPPPADT